MTHWITGSCAVLAAIIVMIVVRWARQTQRVLRLMKQHPDEAYEFFTSHPDNWLMFQVSASTLQADQLPVVPGAPGRKPLGPFEFQVPKLAGRTVSVFGKSLNCFQDLEQLESKMKTKTGGQQPPA